MKSNMNRRLLYICFSLLTVGSTANAQETLPTIQKVDSTGYIVFDGDSAPDFVTTLTDGKKVRLGDLRGKVVMLQFTASWCGVCRKEMPHIEKEIWARHRSNPDFVLIGIDRDEPLKTVRQFAKATGISYPLGLDPQADIFALYALRESGITRNVLIDREGKIVKRTRLFNTDEFESLVNAIDAELAKPYIKRMNAEEFSKLITSDKVQILDVRTADEYAESHIPGSKNVDVLQSDFEQRTADILDAAKPVAVYCRSGKRSMVAAAKLIARGMKVYNLDGGILQWLQENKPVE